jgi:LuxR family maltose regulon positive regulatory protein
MDPERTWFRYHHLFGDLLALELRRTAPEELPGLHTAAVAWFAEHEHPVEAIRHAQAAESWDLAARLLADNWFGLYLDGHLATARELLSTFPAARLGADPELAVLAAEDKRIAGALQDGDGYLSLAAQMAASVPEDRRGRFEIALAMGRLANAQARNDLQAVADQAQRLLASTEATASFEFGLGEDMRRKRVDRPRRRRDMGRSTRGRRARARARAGAGPADPTTMARTTGALAPGARERSSLGWRPDDRGAAGHAGD